MLVYQAGYIHGLYLWKPFTSYNPWDDPQAPKKSNKPQQSTVNPTVKYAIKTILIHVKYVVL